MLEERTPLDKLYAEWIADSVPWHCYIRISPETGIISLAVLGDFVYNENKSQL